MKDSIETRRIVREWERGPGKTKKTLKKLGGMVWRVGWWMPSGLIAANKSFGGVCEFGLLGQKASTYKLHKVARSVGRWMDACWKTPTSSTLYLLHAYGWILHTYKTYSVTIHFPYSPDDEYSPLLHSRVSMCYSSSAAEAARKEERGIGPEPKLLSFLPPRLTCKRNT